MRQPSMFSSAHRRLHWLMDDARRPVLREAPSAPHPRPRPRPSMCCHGAVGCGPPARQRQPQGAIQPWKCLRASWESVNVAQHHGRSEHPDCRARHAEAGCLQPSGQFQSRIHIIIYIPTVGTRFMTHTRVAGRARAPSARARRTRHWEAYCTHQVGMSTSTVHARWPGDPWRARPSGL